MHVSAHHMFTTLRDDERGSVLVFVAVSLLLLVLVAVFVIDVGNWFVHKRHLQTQADAAVLAAANGLGFPCNWAAAQTEGARYGGAPYNPQVGGANQGTLSILFNSATFASGEPPAADPTAVGDACQTGTVDVKATEAHLPLFFSGAVPGLDVTINAHARARVAKVQAMSGFLPLAVQDTNPKYVFARFTRADGSSVLTWLTKGGAVVGSTPWTTPAAVPIPMTSSLSLQVGLVFGKTKSTDCSTAPAVQCFDDVGYVRGWTAASPPVLEDVRILPATCVPDGGFATAPCSLGLNAMLDLGTRPLTGTDVTTHVWATIAGDKTQYDLAAGSGGPGPVTWSLASGIALTTQQASAITVHWDWQQTSGGSCTKAKPCTATGSQAAQRAYLAEETVPLRSVAIGALPDITGGATSFQIGTTQQFLLTVGVRNNLVAAADGGDPTVMLRSASGTGSNSQAVDCDPGVNFADEIRLGCTNTYQINEEAICPNGDSPPSCIATQTGDFVGQLRQGLNARFASCPTNNWGPSSPANIGRSDPRLVPLIVTPSSAFGSGTSLVPVLTFAFFYVTGWDGGTCAGNQPYPGSGTPHGDVWGHFVQYTGFVSGAQPGNETCDLLSGDPSACVVELTG